MSSTSTVDAVGASAIGAVSYIGSLSRFFLRALVSLGRTHKVGAGIITSNTFKQVYFTGVMAVPVVAGLAALLGTVIVLQALTFLSGASGGVVGSLMDYLVIRELAPLMTALIIIGRSGSAITVELGNMKVGGELELLERMGIDPMRFLVVPRMVGVTYASLCLCVVFDFVAVLGGYNIAALAVDTPGFTFLQAVGANVHPFGLVVGLTKSAAFGVVIATISTWQGLAVEGSVTRVPLHTQRSVVHSIVACVVLSVALTLIGNLGMLL